MSEHEPSGAYREPAYWDGHSLKDGHPWTNKPYLRSYSRSLNPIVMLKNAVSEGRDIKPAYETLRDYADISSFTPIKTYADGETFDPNQYATGTVLSFTDETYEPKTLFVSERFAVARNLAMTLDLDGRYDLHKVVFGLINYDILGPAGVPKIFPGPVTVGEVNHGFYNVNRVTSLSVIELGKPIPEAVREDAQQKIPRFTPAFGHF